MLGGRAESAGETCWVLQCRASCPTQDEEVFIGLRIHGAVGWMRSLLPLVASQGKVPVWFSGCCSA